MSRAFVVATGRPVIGYLRARRLPTEAARQLAYSRSRHPVGGPGGRLRLARGVHPRVPRSVRDHPRAGAGGARPGTLNLVEPIVLDASLRTDLSPPRARAGPRPADRRPDRPLRLRGPRRHPRPVAALRRAHRPHPRSGRRRRLRRGAERRRPGQFRLCQRRRGGRLLDLPRTSPRSVPAHLYAVFHHAEHVSTIRRTMHTIYTQWLPNSDYEPADAPFFERCWAGVRSAHRRRRAGGVDSGEGEIAVCPGPPKRCHPGKRGARVRDPGEPQSINPVLRSRTSSTRLPG